MIGENQQNFTKKYCFLCVVARYLTAFALGVIVGWIIGS
jgi:hypothetical protein